MTMSPNMSWGSLVSSGMGVGNSLSGRKKWLSRDHATTSHLTFSGHVPTPFHFVATFPPLPALWACAHPFPLCGPFPGTQGSHSGLSAGEIHWLRKKWSPHRRRGNKWVGNTVLRWCLTPALWGLFFYVLVEGNKIRLCQRRATTHITWRGCPSLPPTPPPNPPPPPPPPIPSLLSHLILANNRQSRYMPINRGRSAK